MIKKFGCVVLIALMAASAAVGCGEDEKPLSKAEFIKQGDAICKKANVEGERQTEAMFKDLDKGEDPSEEQLEEFVDDVLKPNTEERLEDLRDLVPPKGDEDTVNAIYDGFEEGIDKVEDEPKILLSGKDPFKEPTQKAADYGFKVCGR